MGSGAPKRNKKVEKEKNGSKYICIRMEWREDLTFKSATRKFWILCSETRILKTHRQNGII